MRFGFDEANVESARGVRKGGRAARQEGIKARGQRAGYGETLGVGDARRRESVIEPSLHDLKRRLQGEDRATLLRGDAAAGREALAVPHALHRVIDGILGSPARMK